MTRETATVLRALRDEMRARERAVFYSVYPRALQSEAGRTVALEETRMWREKVDALLAQIEAPLESKEPNV